ncbi:MAG: LCP family protein [Sharpea porci]|uniref:LCP family protein n=1 Tax=Sharpea porci TaxID=2652286 RepID=UPI00240935CB|nr:LCP family protein [Sharpea porci]MDD6712363.1 LCP family protein [Sharpea porci]
MKFIKKITSWQVVIVLQLLVSIFLAAVTFKLNVLPIKYLAVMISVLVLLLVGMFFFMREGHAGKHAKTSIRPIIGKIVSLVLSIVLFIASTMLVKTEGAIADITGNDSQTTVISLVTLKSGKYDSADDLKGEEIGVNTKADKKNITKGLKALKEELKFKEKDYDMFKKLGDDLYSGKVKAILMDDAYKAVLETYHEDWDQKTKTIWKYEIHEKVEDTSTNAKVTKEPFTLLVSGVDSRGDVTEKCRSDVDMIITIDPVHRRVLMTSIPRDYFVEIAGQGGKDKLTHSGLFGTATVEKTIENLMDIDIDYNVRIGFQAVTKIIDALGGVDIYSDKAFTPWTDEGVRIQKGMQHMDGRTALAFARERKIYSTGDRHRDANQQVVIEAIIDKLMKPSVLSQYSSLLKALDGTFQTNLKTSDITSLAKMQLDKGGKWTVKKSILWGTPERRTGGLLMPNTSLYYTIPNEESVKTNRQYIKDTLAGKDVQIAKDDESATSHDL